MRPLIFIGFLAVLGAVQHASAQTTGVTTEYLMTYTASLERMQIDPQLVIFNVKAGGAVKGPKISGKIVAPGETGFESCPPEL